VATPDPVDFRLLSLIAEMGRAAVHEVAAKIGIDPRDAAARLVALSATGMPLIVGVECDQNGIRAALTAARALQGQPPQVVGYPAPQPFPLAPQPQYAPPPSTGGFPAQPSVPLSVQVSPRQEPAGGAIWGPPQSAAWARGDQPPAPPSAGGVPASNHTVGERQLTTGLAGEQLSIQLVEVVDPADFLFTAAGYRLQEGERSVVVHTEVTNQGGIPFSALPDLYLVLVTADGEAVSKAPVSLSSRPPYRIGVQPGETAGGHTVYVLPESTVITAVRWSARPDDPRYSLSWTVES